MGLIKMFKLITNIAINHMDRQSCCIKLLWIF